MPLWVGALFLPWIPTSRAKQLVDAIPTQSPFKLTLSGVLILKIVIAIVLCNVLQPAVFVAAAPFFNLVAVIGIVAVAVTRMQKREAASPAV